MKRPIIFSPRYDITLFGIERLHPFDSAKYGKVFQDLRTAGFLDGQNHYTPHRASDELLLRVHSSAYLASLKKSKTIARIAEVSTLRHLPNFLLQWRFLTPMRYATTGTIMGAKLALDHGWAINLSGGYHHAKAHQSSGFCFFADINLAATLLWDSYPDHKILVIDLDAHQGNGFEDIFKDDPRAATLDVYNGQIYPLDLPARKYIKYNHPIAPRTGTEHYLHIVGTSVPQAIDAERPKLIIYNAGSDIYEQDPLGGLSVSAEGVIKRDEMVFRAAKAAGIPLLMVLSGGYTPQSHKLISDSILNLSRQGLLP